MKKVIKEQKIKYMIRLLGLIVFIIIILSIDLNLLITNVLKVNYYFIPLIILINIPHLFIKSLRWNYLLRCQKVQYPIIKSFKIYLSSLAIGYMTPGRVGEFVKVYYLKSDKDINIGKGFSSVIVDRLFDFYLLIIIALFGIWDLRILGNQSYLFLVSCFIFGALPLILLNKNILIGVIKFVLNLKILKNFKASIEDNIEEFYLGLGYLFNQKLFIGAFFTIIGYLLYFLQCHLICIAMGLPIGFKMIILFQAISNLTTFLPISFAGLGTRDASFIFLFSLLNLRPELAVEYSFWVFILIFSFCALLGFLNFITSNINIPTIDNLD